MGVKLADLLKYKKEVPIIVKGKTLSTVWIRVVGDTDLQESYRLGRIASANRRKALLDTESITYKDELGPIDEASKEDCISVIVSSRERDYQALAETNVERPELPKIDEVAVDPDAPTLAEQEALDKKTYDVMKEYEEAKVEYVNNKVNELKVELDNLPIEEIRTIAKQESTNILALTAFLLEVQDQKIFRAVFSDKFCKEREFESIDEFRNTHEAIKEILYREYANLEIAGDDVKN